MPAAMSDGTEMPMPTPTRLMRQMTSANDPSRERCASATRPIVDSSAPVTAGQRGPTRSSTLPVSGASSRPASGITKIAMPARREVKSISAIMYIENMIAVPDQGDVDGHDAGRRRGEGTAAQQAQVEERHRGAQLPEDERGERHRRDGEQAEHERRGPVPRVALDQAPGVRQKRPVDEQRDAGQVDVRLGGDAARGWG